MILLSLLIAFIISKRVSKSIIRVNDSAKELAKGNFDVEFDGKDYREITELSDTLNYTAKELSKSDVLQKELLANVSHDLRTPLTMITAYSEVMRDLPGGKHTWKCTGDYWRDKATYISCEWFAWYVED